MTTFIVQIKNGRIGFLSEYNKARFNDYLKENDNQKLQIKPVSPKVSDEARGYYWGAIIPFLKTINQSWKNLSNDQIHEILKCEFNGFEVDYGNGVIKKYGQSIVNGDVDNKKFQNYILRIADWVMENYNQEMPDPEEYKKFRDSGRVHSLKTEKEIEYPQNDLGQPKF